MAISPPPKPGGDAHDVRALDVQGIQQGRQVVGVQFHRVRSLWVRRLPLAPAVVQEQAVMLRQDRHLVGPAHRAHEDAVQQDQHRGIGRTV